MAKPVVRFYMSGLEGSRVIMSCDYPKASYQFRIYYFSSFSKKNFFSLPRIVQLYSEILFFLLNMRRRVLMNSECRVNLLWCAGGARLTCHFVPDTVWSNAGPILYFLLKGGKKTRIINANQPKAVHRCTPSTSYCHFWYLELIMFLAMLSPGQNFISSE